MRYLPLFAAIFAITPLAIDLYLPAMPIIANDLNTSIQIIQNTLSVYLAGFALGMFIFGPLADKYGRKALVILGLTGFSLFSLLISVSENAEQFLSLRFCQALFGGAATVTIPGAIKQLFGKDTAKGLSYVSMIMMVAPMLAPAIGNYLVELSGWPFIFELLGAYGLFLLLLALIFFPKHNPSALISSEQTEQLGRTDLNPQVRNDNNKLSFVSSYKRVLSQRAIYPYLIISIMGSIVFFTYLTSVSYLYIMVFGFTTTQFSLVFGANAIGLILGNYINAQLVPKIGSRQILRFACHFALWLAFALLLASFNHLSPYIIVSLLIFCLSFIVVIIANSDSLILQQFDEQTGTASAVIGSLRFGSGAIAGPVLAFFFNGTSLPIMLLISLATLILFSSMQLMHIRHIKLQVLNSQETSC
jgi:DHA1 family bicyclomycin/chloramphenicol resistance-like MFS transporter